MHPGDSQRSLVSQSTFPKDSHPLCSCWKEIFPNEDATRFDLVDELYAPPGKMPTSVYQFASWLEDWKTSTILEYELEGHVKEVPQWHHK